PTQLYSARLEVFSNGNTITTSAVGACCACALATGETSVKTRKNAKSNRKLKLQNPLNGTQRVNCSRKLPPWRIQSDLARTSQEGIKLTEWVSETHRHSRWYFHD